MAALVALSDKRVVQKLDDLQEVILLKSADSSTFRTYQDFTKAGHMIDDHTLDSRLRSVDIHDVCNLQFTSGTTGNPKAAMLTHR